nr:retrovirus-related Pol polyprotein from transposon TNT 1-94 [Tanacetum cinerariifolium]
MQEKIHEFDRLQVWELVPPPDYAMIIALKWIYKVKLYEYGDVLKNKAHLVEKGYSQKEGIDFKESFASVSRLEAVRIFIANAASKNMTVYKWMLSLHFLKASLKRKSIIANPRVSLIQISDPVDTPMVECSKLDKDLFEIPVDQTRYHSMIGFSMYLTASRPDLMFAVCMYTTMALTAYADHAGCQYTRRSTSGSAQFLGDKLLSDYGFAYIHVPLYCDNKSAIALCCNNVQHSQSKDIDILHHFIIEQVENGVVELYFVRT